MWNATRYTGCGVVVSRVAGMAPSAGFCWHIGHRSTSMWRTKFCRFVTSSRNCSIKSSFRTQSPSNSDRRSTSRFRHASSSLCHVHPLSDGIWLTAAAMLTRNKNEKLDKRGRGLGHVTYFSPQILGSPSISGTAEDTNLKFCTCIELRDRILNKKTRNQSKQGVA